MARTKDFDEAEVLNKAVCLFWHQGYNATSMQDLVDHLGISRSSLYDTYTDKHTLYIKALEFYQSTSYSQIDKIVQDTGSAKDAIRQLLDLFIRDLLDDEQHKGCFMVNSEVEMAPHDSEVQAIVCKNERRIEEAFYSIIQRGQQIGEITSREETRTLARFILNTVKGARVSAKLTTDKAIFDDIIKITLSVLN